MCERDPLENHCLDAYLPTGPNRHYGDIIKSRQSVPTITVGEAQCHVGRHQNERIRSEHPQNRARVIRAYRIQIRRWPLRVRQGAALCLFCTQGLHQLTSHG